MAIQLMKLMVTADTTVDVKPTVHKFFLVGVPPLIGGKYTITANNFFQGDGSTVSKFPALTGNSYVNLYINGVLQMNNIFTYTPAPGGVGAKGSLAITVPAGSPPIIRKTSVVLEVVDFSLSSTTTVI
ncbi:hypothetical protein CBR56_28785 [Bacillus thuringiensis]|uniref:DUF4183 domain-containing protein n=1 Tax=Bacillus tropicus TaxID=2026188 RepID=UPI000B4420CB|nr:DUF4183 domain-containing protein [Bacillus tropicus]MED3038444.1 DUF4183 domain-containing protein [Bacillus tropicus]OTX84327.1 hypothetical protein BK728_13090 [Bacillus thuringiensis serovar chanpaisis]PNK22686.1 hypothetical protein CBR56_28785 [Bacillus thuringiensis]